MTLLMPCRIASVASIVVVLAVAEARQASAQVMVEALLVPRAVLAAAQTVAIEARPSAVPASVRPAPLMELYVSLASLQALDLTSTRTALNAGGVEANPLVAPLAGSPLAMLALKAGVTGAAIYASERLWKKNRVAAVVTMIGLNAAYGVVVAHNYAVVVRQRR